MKILITGGCGYVGTKLTQAMLARTPHDVTVLDAMWFGNRLAPNPRLSVQAMDVRKIDEVDLAPYDTIVHLANIANDPSVELNPYSSWEVNVLAGHRHLDEVGVAAFCQPPDRRLHELFRSRGSGRQADHLVARQ